jgi:hypothetical protein
MHDSTHSGMSRSVNVFIFDRVTPAPVTGIWWWAAVGCRPSHRNPGARAPVIERGNCSAAFIYPHLEPAWPVRSRTGMESRCYLPPPTCTGFSIPTPAGNVWVFRRTYGTGSAKRRPMDVLAGIRRLVLVRRTRLGHPHSAAGAAGSAVEGPPAILEYCRSRSNLLFRKARSGPCSTGTLVGKSEANGK